MLGRKVLLLVLLYAQVVMAMTSFQQTMYDLYQNPDMRDKIVWFFQKAADKFKVSGQRVLACFFEGMDSSIAEITFQNYEEFEQWALSQQKAVLFLYESDNIECCAFYEYLKNLINDQSVVVVKTVLSGFVQKIVAVQTSNQEALMIESEVLPNVLFVQQGQIYQLRLDDLVLNLPDIVGQFFYNQ